MGGDNAPKATIAGAVLARNTLAAEDQIVLIGDQETILCEFDAIQVSSA